MTNPTPPWLQQNTQPQPPAPPPVTNIVVHPAPTGPPIPAPIVETLPPGPGPVIPRRDAAPADAQLDAALAEQPDPTPKPKPNAKVKAKATGLTAAIKRDIIVAGMQIGKSPEDIKPYLDLFG